MSMVKFWQTEGINNYRGWLGGPELYEGEPNVANTVRVVGPGTVRDVGCGYGRLCNFFKVEDYVGYDICEAAINKAIRLKSPYEFKHWDFSPLPFANTTLFANGPHLVVDEEIESLISILCTNTNAVVFSEIMDSTWKPNTVQYGYSCHYRDITTYDDIMKTKNFTRVRTEISPHLLWDRLYTVARWEHNG